MTETMKAREDAPDVTGIVRRGEAATMVRGYVENHQEHPGCFVGYSGSGFECEEPATMEVYGLPMCEEHGEEAASGALEELSHHVEMESRRLLNPYVTPLNPDVKAALTGALDTLTDEVADAGRGEWRTPALLECAFPLDRDRADVDTLAYVEDPDSNGRRGYPPPFDNFMEDRMLVCRLMREAFEEKSASWLVEILEVEREKVAAQAAYVLALEREAGLLSQF